MPAPPIRSGIPAAALGARTPLALPSHAVDISIGLFLIAMVPVRHWLARHQLKLSLWHLAVGGAVIGYITGIVVSTGPLSAAVPVLRPHQGRFRHRGGKPAWALCVSKSVTFQQFRRADAGCRAEGPDRWFVTDGGRFIAKDLIAA